MTLKQHRSRHPVDALTALFALDSAGDERAFRSGGREPLVYQLDGQPRFASNGIRQPSRRCRLGPVRAVQPQGQPDDETLGAVGSGDGGDARGQALDWIRGHRRQRLRDGFGRVAEREADSLGPRIDREYPHPMD
jgi:hypothetical protein